MIKKNKIMSLTLKEAFEFSIKKFEAIIKNDGLYISVSKQKELGIYGFIQRCGLCQYHEPNCNLDCQGCPLEVGQINCYHEDHIYQKWENDETKENAQAVLDLIISEYNKHLKWNT